MNSEKVVSDLRRDISPDGRTLLKANNLLRPLVEQMVTSEAIQECPVSDGALDNARQNLLEQRGFESIEQWPELLRNLGRTEEEVLDRLQHVVRRQHFIRERFSPKAEARFLERKNELDQVVYSLLRIENSSLARELYLQIESGESNFADLAKRYAEGPERNTNGIVGPVSLTQAHPQLVEKLRVTQPGVLLEPFRISEWWLVVRLERYSPATFSDEISDRMCQEMFDAWIAEQTSTTLSRLEADSSDFSVS